LSAGWIYSSQGLLGKGRSERSERWKGKTSLGFPLQASFAIIIGDFRLKSTRNKKMWSKFASPKIYSAIVGLILFVIGIWGFAFRTDSGLPDRFLILFLVLGFWGILNGFSKKQ
jgi:hypothetical protein